MPSVKYSELELALWLASEDLGIESGAWVSRETGLVYSTSEETADEDELPPDVGDPSRYAVVPDKRDLDLGNRLVFAFVAREMPDRYDEVRSIFRRKGAYGRYKDLLERHGMLDAWFEFEHAATRRALCEWAESEGFTVVDDRGGSAA